MIEISRELPEIFFERLTFFLSLIYALILFIPGL